MKTMFEGIGNIAAANWRKIIILFAVLFLVSGFFSKLLFDNLKVSWIDMVPRQTRVVEEYQKILKDFTSASGMVITVQGPDRETIERVITAVGPRLQKRRDLFRHVFYQNNKTFMGRYALLLQKAEDLKRNTPYLSDFNLVPFVQGINNGLESEYVGNADNMRKNENDISTFLTGLEDLATMIKKAADGEQDLALVERNSGFFTSGPEFFISPDGKVGLITATPAVSIDDVYGCVRIANDLDTFLLGLKEEFPDVAFGQTGMHTLTRDEMETSTGDSMVVTMVAFFLIVIFLITAFRMKSAPVMGMLTLIVGITLCLGISYIVIGSLNMMTVMVGAILMGLGIDYSVHILSQFTEAIAAGSRAREAVRIALRDCGRGVMTGALTTAAAFGIMILIPYQGLAELGAVTAIGVLSCMLTSLFFLPSMLMLRGQIKERRTQRTPAREKRNRLSMRYDFLAAMERGVNRWPLITVTMIALFTVWMAVQIPGALFSGDLKEIEMKGLKSLQLNDLIKEKFDMTADSVYVVTTNLEDDRKYRKILEDNPQISMVDSPSLYLPSRTEQKKRLAWIRKVAAKLKAFRIADTVDQETLNRGLLRLKANVLELRDLAYTSGLDRVFKRCNRILGGKGQGSAGILDRAAAAVAAQSGALIALQKAFAAAMRARILPMTRVTGIKRQNLPQDLRSRLFSKDGEKGLLTAWLMKDNWAELHRSPFLDNLVKTSKGKVTGMILFMRELVNIASDEGGRATLLALGMILLIVLLDFRSFKYGGLAFLNLVAVLITITGLFVLTGQKFNFMNVLALPLLIGIGIDDSVHILHRYRSHTTEGLETVLASTGRGILLTSLTTMVGFGSLTFARFQGLQSFGLVLFFGVGIAFFYSVIFLPALIRLFPGHRKENSGNKGS